MKRRISYDEAKKFLGTKEHRLVTALDKILGGTLLAGATLASPLLALFDAKTDLIRLSHEALTALSEKRSGLSRYNRTQRLSLAHEVVVLVAFCEAFDELRPPIRSDELDISDGTTCMGGPHIPLPDRSYESNLAILHQRYRDMSVHMLDFVQGLAVWDELDETQRDRVSTTLTEQLPSVAVRRYEELFRRLAVEHPEVAFWASVQDGRATRTALSAVEETLGKVASGQAPDARREDLARRNRAVLNRPIIVSEDVPDGLTIPLLGAAYVDPRFRVGSDVWSPSNPFGGSPADESWWADLSVRCDLDTFLTGYLTSESAVGALCSCWGSRVRASRH